jgi:hypothetical protein
MMAVLVDTSVWVDHFPYGNAALERLLMQDAVLCHPWVLGEIACGTPPARLWTLDKRLDALAERFGVAFASQTG